MIKVLLLISAVFFVSHSYAQDFRCSDVFYSGIQSEAVRNIVSPNALHQWRRWEQTSNNRLLLKPTEPIAFQVSRIPIGDVEIWNATKGAEAIAARFVKEDYVLFPKHPYNQDMNVPFATLPNTKSPMPMWLTASRSAAPVDYQDITVKTGTDHPHGKDREYEPRKVKTGEDIRDAMLRAKHYQRVDEEMGEDPVLIMLPDVFAIIDKKSRDGVLVRDISRLDDGRYYLPGFSVPYAGREIANALGKNFERLFGEVYARNLGRGKARKLLRYGLQMDTPNSQNYLIPLTRNLEPTNQIVFRDSPDSYFVEPIALALGFRKAVEADRRAGLRIDQKVNPDWPTSNMLMDDAGVASIDRKTLEAWGRIHDVAYLTEIENALGVVIMSDKSPDSWLRAFLLPGSRQPVTVLNDYLLSDEGLAALQRYALKYRATEP